MAPRQKLRSRQEHVLELPLTGATSQKVTSLAFNPKQRGLLGVGPWLRWEECLNDLLGSFFLQHWWIDVGSGAWFLLVFPPQIRNHLHFEGFCILHSCCIKSRLDVTIQSIGEIAFLVLIIFIFSCWIFIWVRVKVSFNLNSWYSVSSPSMFVAKIFSLGNTFWLVTPGPGDDSGRVRVFRLPFRLSEQQKSEAWPPSRAANWNRMGYISTVSTLSMLSRSFIYWLLCKKFKQGSQIQSQQQFCLHWRTAHCRLWAG